MEDKTSNGGLRRSTQIADKLNSRTNRWLVIILLVILIPLSFFLFSRYSASRIENSIFYPNAPYIGDQLIVKYKDTYTLEEINSLKNSLDKSGVIDQRKVFNSDSPNLKNFYVLTFKKGTDIKKVAEDFSKLPEFEAVGPNYLVKIKETPNDPGFSKQWDMTKIDMPNAWTTNKGSNNVTVAVVDTGIDFNHVDLPRNIIHNNDANFVTCTHYADAGNDQLTCPSQNTRNPGGAPMDDNSHGTHVAGTIGAATNNGVGVAGENWSVTLMAVKTMNADGEGTIDQIVEGIRYAVDNGAKIINLSLTSTVPCTNSGVAGYQDIINYADSKGVLLVSAAGNEDSDASTETPPSCGHVLVVGSTDQNDKRASDSNYGSLVNIAAPGVGILSTVPNNAYQYKSGTSMATPHVVGIAALLLAANPSLTPEKLKSCIVNNADPIQTDLPIGPRLNAAKTLNSCGNNIPTPTPIAQPTTVSVNPTSSQQQVASEIDGIIFIDSNGNGIKDAGEPAFTNVQIITEGQEARSAIPDSSGNFKFTNLSPGTYSVSALINGVKRLTTIPQALGGQVSSFSVVFPVPPIAATPTPVSAGGGGGPTPTPITVAPSVNNTNNSSTVTPATVTPTKKVTPTPKPVAIYTCQIKPPIGAKGSISLGALTCTCVSNCSR